MLKCDKKGCLVKMVVPMKCEGCDDLFCAIHRFSKDHFCNSSKLKLKGKENISNTKKNWSTIELEKIKNPISLPSIKPKSQNPPPPPLSPPSSSPQTTLKATVQKPLTQLKISKQALSERKSQKKGLEIRAKKGLLNEREILEYATLCALESKGGTEGGEGKGCLIC